MANLECRCGRLSISLPAFVLALSKRLEAHLSNIAPVGGLCLGFLFLRCGPAPDLRCEPHQHPMKETIIEYIAKNLMK